MTEPEWLGCIAPITMLEHVARGMSERKQRLFRCACCRDVWHLLAAEASRDAVEVSERYADGSATAAELKDRYIAARRVVKKRTVGLGYPMWAARVAASSSAPGMAPMGTSSAAWEVAQAATNATKASATARQAGLLRDIVGNPFRPTLLRPEWLTPDVSSLTHAAYEVRILPGAHLETARLAVLSDALEEAGCDDTALLDHLRSPGPHVRGCWALDLLIGWK